MIRKAVIPAARLGTRMLPLTKTQPKEMLPLADKPCIQYIIEELASVGVDQVLIITSQKKRAIEDHFDKDMELNSLLSSSIASSEHRPLMQRMIDQHDKKHGVILGTRSIPLENVSRYGIVKPKNSIVGYAVNLTDKEKRYDIGNMASYYEAFLDFALADPRYGCQIKQYLISSWTCKEKQYDKSNYCRQSRNY